MLFQTSEKYFREVLEESQDKLVLVDFYASWCAPCRFLAPQLDALSDQYEQIISAYSVNIDKESHLADDYQVKNLPAVMLIRNGEIIQRWEKDIPVQQIEQKIKNPAL